VWFRLVSLVFGSPSSRIERPRLFPRSIVASRYGATQQKWLESRLSLVISATKAKVTRGYCSHYLLTLVPHPAARMRHNRKTRFTCGKSIPASGGKKRKDAVFISGTTITSGNLTRFMFVEFLQLMKWMKLFKILLFLLLSKLYSVTRGKREKNILVGKIFGSPFFIPRHRWKLSWLLSFRTSAGSEVSPNWGPRLW